HFADKASQLALQAANVRTGDTTVESIKKSMDDGTLDKATGKQLIEDAYRAQISGQTTPERPANTANNSELAQAGAAAVRLGRPVKVTTDHPDGTKTTVDQSKATAEEGTGTAPAPAMPADLTEDFVAAAIKHEFKNGKEINDFFQTATGKDFIDWF